MRRNESVVYSAINEINNKSYIGFCTDFKERKARHLRSAETGVDTHFYNAIRKYGKNAFTWIVLFDNLGGLEDCKIMEKRMIALFDTYENGYNSTLGGDGGDTYSKLKNNSGVFKKGSIPWNKGLKMPEEHCEKLSKVHTGIPLSKKHARKIAQAHYKPVKQLTKDGELIRVWESTTGAAGFTGINKTSIYGVLKGKNKMAGGYCWQYYNN